jgi:hypothetical protein
MEPKPEAKLSVKKTIIDLRPSAVKGSKSSPHASAAENAAGGRGQNPQPDQKEVIALLQKFGWKGNEEETRKVLESLQKSGFSVPAPAPLSSLPSSEPNPASRSESPRFSDNSPAENRSPEEKVRRSIPSVLSVKGNQIVVSKIPVPSGSSSLPRFDQPPSEPPSPTPSQTAVLPNAPFSSQEASQVSEEVHLPTNPTTESTRAPTEAEPPPEPNPPSQTGAALSALEFCPRCGFDLKSPYKVEASTDDRIRFQLALLSGERFTKAYFFFDGAMKVVFRALSSREAETAYACTLADALRDSSEKTYRSTLEYWGLLISYRLALSIQEFYTDRLGGITLPEFEEIEFENLPPQASNTEKLRALHEYVLNHVLRLESIKRIVGATFQEFQKLYEHLEQEFLWKKKTV